MRVLSTLLPQLATPGRLGRLAACAALLGATSLSAQAQLDTKNYVWTTRADASLATGRSGAIDMSTGTTQLFGPGEANVAGSAFQPIGFDLWFYGQRFSQFSAGPTGLLSLAEEKLAPNASLTGGLERFGAFMRAYAAADGTTLGPAATGKIHYKTSGTAPNRVLVVEYLNQGVLGGSGSTADATYQIRFYETSNVIEYVYGEMNIGASGASKGYQVGITHKIDATVTPTVYNTIYVATSIPEARYNVGAFSGVNAQPAGPILALTSSTANQRRIYTFDPTPTTAAPLAAPAGFTAKAGTNGSVDVSFTDGANEIAYEVYYSTSGPDFGLNPTAGAGTADYGRVQVLSPTTGGGTVTANIPGLKANTKYYLKAFALREALSAPATATVTTGVVTGTASAALTAAVNVFPNPGNGNFTLEINDRSAQRWQVSDLQGRVVAEGRAVTGRQELKLGSVAAGVYVLQVQAPSGVGVRRLLVQ